MMRTSSSYIFTTPSPVDGTSGAWIPWVVPKKNKSMAYFLLIGAGAGGGGATTNTATGAGGGASGGILKAIVPLLYLPDRLYIQVGMGGLGGSSGNNGGSGGLSYVSIAPDIIAQDFLLQSSATAPGGGNTITTGGTASTLTAVGSMRSGIFCSMTAIGGESGGNGGTSANGTNKAAFGTAIVGGGTGGGSGSTHNGGAITAAGLLAQNIPGGTGSTNNPGNRGSDGLNCFGSSTGWYFTGGTGGGGTDTTTAGAGGNGGRGSGGGGGGAIDTSGTGGAGGNGGHGIIGIWCI